MRGARGAPSLPIPGERGTRCFTICHASRAIEPFRIVIRAGIDLETLVADADPARPRASWLSSEEGFEASAPVGGEGEDPLRIDVAEKGDLRARSARVRLDLPHGPARAVRRSPGERCVGADGDPGPLPYDT